MSNTKKKVEVPEEEKLVTEQDMIEKVTKDDSKDKEIEALKAQIKALEKEKNQSLKKQKEDILNSRVEIIHLVERAPGLSTYAELKHTTVILNKFGETRMLEYPDFQELVGRCRNWFEQGILAVCSGYEEVMERYSLPQFPTDRFNGELFSRIGRMDMKEFETLFEALPEGGKNGIVAYWTRKVAEGDPNFKNPRKIEVLNRLTDGACTQILSEANK